VACSLRVPSSSEFVSLSVLLCFHNFPIHAVNVQVCADGQERQGEAATQAACLQMRARPPHFWAGLLLSMELTKMLVLASAQGSIVIGLLFVTFISW
jgi:hypothetical protein